jgi:hypothetical protein
MSARVTRLLLLSLGLSLAGCQCFQPVDELPTDSGTGGGAAGGSGGGGASASGGGTSTGGGSGGGTAFTDGGCGAPADCSGTQMSVPFCGAVAGAGWSCVDHSCLWECNGGRTCEIDADAGCVHCDNLGTECAQTFCSATTRMATIESSTCGAPQKGNPAVVSGGTGCDFLLTVGGEIDLGHIQQVAGGDFIADFPALGGECTGTILPTNLERWVFNCPGCQFVVSF